MTVGQLLTVVTIVMDTAVTALCIHDGNAAAAAIFGALAMLQFFTLALDTGGRH